MILAVLILLPFFLFVFFQHDILSFLTLSPSFTADWCVFFLQDISYHCSSVRSTMPLCFLPRLGLCPHPFVLRPPGSASCFSAFPRLMLLRGPRPSHSLSPVPREPARLIKGKQTLRFPPALCKTLLIKENKTNFMIH